MLSRMGIDPRTLYASMLTIVLTNPCAISRRLKKRKKVLVWVSHLVWIVEWLACLKVKQGIQILANQNFFLLEY